MKISYFGSTWVASCVTSVGGALYAAMVAAVIDREIDLMMITGILIGSILLSLPVLILGSATIGWWVTRMLIRRVVTKRLWVFAMTGMAMGIFADLVLLVLWGVFVRFMDMPRNLEEWGNAILAASIPVFYLTLAGWVAGAHSTYSEQAGGDTVP